MSYSSDVRIVIRGRREVILREFAHLRLQGDDVMRGALDEWRIMAETLGIGPPEKIQAVPAAVAILGKGGVDWKWYQDFPDVKAHNAIFRHFSELFDNTEDEETRQYLSGSFVRIGENWDDLEENNFGDYYDLAQATRTIDCPYDKMDEPDLRPRVAAP